MREEQGIIIKGIGGFYYVEASGKVYECRARGIFRKNAQAPLVGDRAVISLDENGCGTVEKILPRKNELTRPPVSNLDQLVIVVSVCDPAPNPLIIDKTIAVAERKGIEPIIAVSKSDLKEGGWLADIYRTAGFQFYEISSATGEGLADLRKQLCGKITVFTGNSGVGKSTLLNRIDARFALPTGEISKKLGRGRHTTRFVELLPLEGGGYAADTPGFSSLSMERYDVVHKEELASSFREFVPYLGECRFQSCSHTCEKGCAVLDAVRAGRISNSRHESYKAMYQEVKDLKEWEMK